MTVEMTTQEREDLRDLADSIFAGFAESCLDIQRVDIPFELPLWKTAADSGLTLMSTPEDRGGSGASIREAAVVLERAAAHCAPLPIAETDFLAAWLLATSDIPIPDGPLTAATTSVEIVGSRLRAEFDRVPWAESAVAVVVAAGNSVVLVPADSISTDDGVNLAYEPRNHVAVDVALSGAQSGTVPGSAAEQFRFRGALARSIQTTAAVEAALRLSVEHAAERTQFGRPLGKFQAVQALVSDAAGAVAMTRAATDSAVAAAAEHGFAHPRAHFAIAIAKSQSARAARVVSRSAHQVHGAIGFTLDHRLRHYTSRALAWRSEFGDHLYWDRWLGELALGQSSSGVWELVTDGPNDDQGES